MAKHNDTTRKTTHHDGKVPKPQGWKLDRYEQRTLKVTARRSITGGF